MNIGQPSLDQLRIFLCVVDEGSFNRAAKKMGRAISVISYGIGNLESQLGVSLFKRGGAKRPVLTDAGKAVLAEARAAVDEVDGLVAKVRGMQRGLETELAVAVEVMFPTDLLAGVLREFQDMFPTVTLRLHVEALGAIAALLIDKRADLGIGGPVISEQEDLARKAIGHVQLVPVAAPSHRLAKLGEIVPGESRKHLQLVLTDRSSLTAGREFSVISPRTWRLADLGAKHALLREGIGWGNMPQHMIKDDLESGRLVALKLPEDTGQVLSLSALWRKDDPPGPAAQWLLSALEQAMGVQAEREYVWSDDR